jgi:uncharacterized protein YndB with AHSA1/START domain
VAFLKKRHRLSQWWQQVVTGGYEIIIGRRIEGQNLKGESSLVASRTFAMAPLAVWKMLESKDGQAIWLKPLSDFEFKAGRVYESEGGVYGEIKTLKKPNRVRMSWQEDGWAKASTLQIALVARPKGKSILVFQQDGLLSPRLRDDLRERWKEALVGLLALAEKI